MTNAITLQEAFNGHSIDIIALHGSRWVMGGQIGHPIGYEHQRAFKRLISKHRDEFGLDDMMVVELPDRLGRMQLTRIFSEKGVTKLAMLAQTPRAAAFRDWAARVLTEPRPVAQPVLEMHGGFSGTALMYLRQRFKADPRHRKVMRYAKLGLKPFEIARLVDWHAHHVRKAMRAAEALGFIEATSEQLALRTRATTGNLIGARKHV
jgi:hypothetical protein